MCYSGRFFCQTHYSVIVGTVNVVGGVDIEGVAGKVDVLGVVCVYFAF